MTEPCHSCGILLDEDGECVNRSCIESPYYVEEEDCSDYEGPRGKEAFYEETHRMEQARRLK